mgnify:CR=1 FL=1
MGVYLGVFGKAASGKCSGCMGIQRVFESWYSYHIGYWGERMDISEGRAGMVQGEDRWLELGSARGRKTRAGGFGFEVSINPARPTWDILKIFSYRLL